MRAANLRPLRQNKMDFSSPSRGELTPGRSLTDKRAQEEFRAHLENRVVQHQAKYSDELAIIIENNQHQKDELDLILLEFRKLREGIISCGRADDFAVEVYETSAKLALLSNNIPQIASILPHLVKTLHGMPKSTRRDELGSTDLEANMKELGLSDRTAVPLDTRARFLSYYLLHLICQMQDTKAFQHLLKEAVNFSQPKCTIDKIASTSSHIVFAVHVFHCFIRNDYAAMSKILSRPRAYDKFAWIIVRSAQPVFQDKAWQTLRTSYMLVENKSWLARQLQLPDDTSLQAFLEKAKWNQKVDGTGAILLKKA